MDFNLATWQQAATEKLSELAHWLDQWKQNDVPFLLYGTLCGLTLWPLLEAAQSGQLLPAITALGSVAAGVGGNLIAEQIQRWKDQAERVDVIEIGSWAAENATTNLELRDAFDAILQRLDAISQAQSGVSEKDRTWFSETLRSELTQLGNLAHFQITVIRSDVVAQGTRAIAAGQRGVATAEDIEGTVITGDGNVVVNRITQVNTEDGEESAE